MEKINFTKQNSVITPNESPGITLGTCVTPGQTCTPQPWGCVCGNGCIGIECY